MSKNKKSKSNSQKRENLVTHILTDGDLLANPDLVEKGLSVGDKVQIPKSAYDEYKKAGENKSQDDASKTAKELAGRMQYLRSAGQDRLDDEAKNREEVAKSTLKGDVNPNMKGTAISVTAETQSIRREESRIKEEESQKKQKIADENKASSGKMRGGIGPNQRSGLVMLTSEGSIWYNGNRIIYKNACPENPYIPSTQQELKDLLGSGKFERVIIR